LWTKFDTLVVRVLLYASAEIGELWPRRSRWGAKIPKGVQIVTIFSYIVWSSAVKFGSVGGVATSHLFPEFGERWFRGSHNMPCGDMHQSFTDALVFFSAAVFYICRHVLLSSSDNREENLFIVVQNLTGIGAADNVRVLTLCTFGLKVAPFWTVLWFKWEKTIAINDAE